jgi:hypothetical protein
MRLYIYVLISLIFFAGCATTLPPAGPASDPMEKADTIWIETTDDSETAYRKIAQLISDQGFSISNSDATLMVINTDLYQPEESFGESLSSGGMEMKITASIRNNDGTWIKLNGSYNTAPQGNLIVATKDNEIRNEGSKNTAPKRAWNILNEIAAKYSPGELYFSRN